MAMSPRIRRELGKGRELLWLLLVGKRCCFCRKLFLQNGIPAYVRLGNGSAPPLDLDITEHHKDEDHSNNDPKNLALAHSTCHKVFHAKKVFRTWRAA